MVADVFAAELAAGYDIRPTIAVTKAHVILPEVIEAMQNGRLQADGTFLTAGGAALVTKAAIEPVWYLPGVARALRLHARPTCAACCSRRPAACTPSW